MSLMPEFTQILSSQFSISLIMILWEKQLIKSSRHSIIPIHITATKG